VQEWWGVSLDPRTGKRRWASKTTRTKRGAEARIAKASQKARTGDVHRAEPPDGSPGALRRDALRRGFGPTLAVCDPFAGETAEVATIWGPPPLVVRGAPDTTRTCGLMLRRQVPYHHSASPRATTPTTYRNHDLTTAPHSDTTHHSASGILRLRVR